MRGHRRSGAPSSQEGSRLALACRLWQEAKRLLKRSDACVLRCCSSSVVEHSLGKGEVESSILSCSTSDLNKLHGGARSEESG
jgi:hypothetical protein